MASKDGLSALHKSLPQTVSQSKKSKIAVGKNQADDDSTLKLIAEECLDTRSHSPIEGSGTPQTIKEVANPSDKANKKTRNNPFQDNVAEGTGDKGVTRSLSRRSSVKRKTDKNKENILSDCNSKDISSAEPVSESDNLSRKEADVKPDVSEATSNNSVTNKKNEEWPVSNKASPNSKKLDDILQKIPLQADHKNDSTAENSEHTVQNGNLSPSSSSEKSFERRTPRKQDNPLKRSKGEDSSPECTSPKVCRRLLSDELDEDANLDNSLDNEKKSSRYGRVQRQRSMGPDMKMLPLVNRHKQKTKEASPKTPRITFTPKKVIGAGDYVKRLLKELMSEVGEPVPGDLFWSRIPGHPYWPCMVALDPLKGVYRKELTQRNRKGTVYHVQYFGKETQRGWTVPDGIIPFRGQKNLEKLIEDLTGKTPEGPDRDFLAFIFKINPNRVSNLNIAIQEAAEAYNMTRSERNRELTFEYRLPSGKSFIPICEESDIQTGKPSMDSMKQSSNNSSKTNGFLTHDDEVDFDKPKVKRGRPRKSGSNDSPDSKNESDKKSKGTSRKSEANSMPSDVQGTPNNSQNKRATTKMTNGKTESVLSNKSLFENKHIKSTGTTSQRAEKNISDYFTKSPVETKSKINGSKVEEQNGNLLAGQLISPSAKQTSRKRKMSNDENSEKQNEDVPMDTSPESKLDSSSVLDTTKSEDSDDLEVVFVNIKPKKKKRRKKRLSDTPKENTGSTEDSSTDAKLASVKEKESKIESDSLGVNNTTESVSITEENISDNVTESQTDMNSENETEKSALNELSSKSQLIASVNGEGDSSKTAVNGIDTKQSSEDLITAISTSRRSRRDASNTPVPEDIPNEEKESETPSTERKLRVVRKLSMTGKPSSTNESRVSKGKSNEGSDVDYSPEEETETVTLQKKKYSQKSKGNFSAYVEQHLNQYKEQNPSLSMKDLEAYMLYDWENLPEQMKNTYVVHFPSAVKKTFSSSGHKTATVVRQRKPLQPETIDPTPKNSDADTESEETESTCSTSSHDGVCVKCEKPGELTTCNGECQQLFHNQCLDNSKGSGNKLSCTECISGKHSCFKCKSNDGEVAKCPIASCGKFYHQKCLSACTAAFNGDGKISSHKGCPLHSCLTCNLNNPKGVSLRRARLKRCTRCPVAYHSGDGCLAAGSQTLSRTCIICPNHFAPRKGNPYHTHVSVNWCFSCSQGGQLVCCESCPSAFHPECLDVDPPEGSFFCEDCSVGKHPCYGDIVWVKLGSYRWWPAEICQPANVPQNIQNLPHTIGQFPVRFFGSHDYFWIHRGRVFLFHEGDKGSKYETSRHLAQVFQKAVDEATDAFQKLTSAKVAREIHLKNKKPPPFKLIKSNRPVGKVQLLTQDESNLTVCECNPNKPNPCGIDSQCLNRVLMVECCPAVCPAKDKCENQMFMKREYVAATPTLYEGRGWGLAVLEDIKKGAFVAEYVGELIDEEECQRRLRAKHEETDANFYFLTLDKDRIIDAGPKGNLSRFINHSCKPNCESQKWTVNGDTRVGIFAISDIPAGSELTFNYNLDCYGNEKTKCACGSDNCSGYIGVRPKTITALGTEKRAKDSNKKRRRYKTNLVPKHEDECFRCQEGGELMMCDRKGCTKAYHLNCLSLDKPPHGRWECPWHHCDDCGCSATLLCNQCPNSFCKEHGTEKNITELDGIWVCSEHWDYPNGSDDGNNKDGGDETGEVVKSEVKEEK